MQKHNFIHLNLCLALSCGLVVFLGGVEHAAKYDVSKPLNCMHNPTMF